jgi:hypothetical protein
MSIQYPTIVTCFYNIRKLEKNIDKSHNRQIDKYLELASQFILKLPYPIIFFTDDEYVSSYILQHRESMMDKTYLYYEDFQETFFFPYQQKITDLQTKFTILNGDKNHETPLYIILNNNKFHFVEKAMEVNPFSSTHFIWMDFGINHCARQTEKIHEWIHYVPDKIKQLCINPYFEKDERKDFFKFIYHHTAGGLFSGNIENMTKYIQYFKEKIDEVYSQNWYQIDEAIMTMVQQDHPELFEFFYGDYEGIICNYYQPYLSLPLIFKMLDKSMRFHQYSFCYQLCLYLEPFFQNKNEQKTEHFYQWIQYHIFSDFVGNHQYINKRALIYMNQKLLEKDESMLKIIEGQKNLLQKYKNFQLIIL